jgi:deoxycytidine triphosphate deaminase
MQLIFIRLENGADKLYEGVYQGENIDDEDDKSI